jgi:hypothetical protein
LLKEFFFQNKPRNAAPASVDRLIEKSSEQLKAGNIDVAEKTCIDALALFPDDVRLSELLSDIELAKSLAIVNARFPGPHYLKWLQWFHTKLKPANYLEIGVESGQSLKLANSPTRAVGVDPAIQIVHSQEIWVKLFKLTSDDFFATHDLQQVFGSQTINLAFIDGLHTFDQALKDFINIERFSDASTVVLFHDIFPVFPATAQRTRTTRFWVGDTWKVMLILLKHRPDLKIFTIPTHPSGLGVVTGLASDSMILQENFDLICRQAMELELDAFPMGVDDHLQVVENNFDVVGRLLDNGQQ